MLCEVRNNSEGSSSDRVEYCAFELRYNVSKWQAQAAQR